MQHCDTCGKDFYSDTDFEEHQFQEQILESMRQAQQGNMHLGSVIRMGVVHMIMHQEGLSFGEAVTTYLDRGTQFNQLLATWMDGQQ